MTSSNISLVDKFNQIQGMEKGWDKDRAFDDFRRKVQELLEYEARDLLGTHGEEELEEYRRFFEWEATYWIKYEWELDASHSYTKNVASYEDLQKHLSEEIEPPEPEEYQKENPYWKDDVDVRLYYATQTPWIFCRNFRLIEEN